VKSVKKEEIMIIHSLRFLSLRMFQASLLLLLMKNNLKFLNLVRSSSVKDQIVTGETFLAEVALEEVAAKEAASEEVALAEVDVKEEIGTTKEEEDITGIIWLKNFLISLNNMLTIKLKKTKKKQKKVKKVNGNKENGEKKELKYLRFLKKLLKVIQDPM
jgi:hypothetical protein